MHKKKFSLVMTYDYWEQNHPDMRPLIALYNKPVTVSDNKRGCCHENSRFVPNISFHRSHRDPDHDPPTGRMQSPRSTHNSIPTGSKFL